jgi:Protein of unknown function (DUF3987)
MSEFDLSHVVQTLEVLSCPGAVVEVRLIDTKQKTVSGYFNDPQRAAQAIKSWDGQSNAYITLNTVNPALLARAINRLKPFADKTTSDTDITRRRWLFIDLDPVRPAGISTNEAEHAAAKERSSQIGRYLRERDWPDPVVCDSGNGWHLLYAIDLPNDEIAKNLVNKCLEALSLMFTDDRVEIDRTAFNAARITKLYGTLACKGDSTDDRPHRRSFIAHTPKSKQLVTEAQLQELAAILPRAEPKPVRNGKSPAIEFDIEDWMSRYGISIKRSCDWNGGKKWIISPCPWNSDHTDNGAFIVRMQSGAIAAGCHHASCHGRTWHDLRLLYEPDAYDKPEPAQPLPSVHSPVPASLVSLMPPSRVQVIRELHQVEPVCASDDWEEPLTLIDAELPDFPIEALPSVLAEHVHESAYAIQTPIAMQAMGALAVIAAVNSRRCNVQLRSGAWPHIEPLNLYITIAADPGERKSPALKSVSFPLDNMQMEIRNEKSAEYAARAAIFDTKLQRLAELKKQAAKTNDFAEAAAKRELIAELAEDIASGPPPSVPQLLIQDITTEALASVLADQEDNCSALITPEGGVFSIIKGQYASKGSMPNMDLWLKAWGGEYHEVNRKSTGITSIKHPMLTIGMMVQPVVLRALLQNEMMKENGFIDRFLYCIPPSLAGWRDSRDVPYPNADYAYDRLIRQLWALPKSATPDNRANRFTITLTPDARAVYDYCQSQIEHRIRPDCDLYGMKGWASKFPGTVARIAGNIHMVKTLDAELPWNTPISAETMSEAWSIGAYLVPHAMSAYNQMRTDPCTNLAKRILKWAERKQKSAFTLKECYEAHHTTENKEQLSAALLKLIDHGYIRFEQRNRDGGAKGGPTPKPWFVIHPNIAGIWGS